MMEKRMAEAGMAHGLTAEEIEEAAAKVRLCSFLCILFSPSCFFFVCGF
jgi:hypothetical protein